LESIDSKNLKLYVVWEPILSADNERWARKSTTLLDDPRVEHFWIDSQDVGEAFQEPIMLQAEPAWDVYLAYPGGVEWKSSSPPKPEYFQHQLGGRLPKAQQLDGAALAKRLEAMLAKE